MISDREYIYRCLGDIPRYKYWKSIEKISEGFSKSEKFYIVDKKGREYLLRMSEISEYEIKKTRFEYIQAISKLDIPMSKAIEFGICNHGKSVYMLLSWVQGESIDKIINDLSEEEQYQLGIKAGKLLRKIHSLKVYGDISYYYNAEIKCILRKLDRFRRTKYYIKKDEKAIRYVERNIYKIKRVYPVYVHGDFHMGNIILTPEHTVGVIDFDGVKIGNPYEEFYNNQQFDVHKSKAFARGKIDGYFDNKPPKEFWEILAIYNAFRSLIFVLRRVALGEEGIRQMFGYTKKMLEDYDYFDRIIPKWYVKNKPHRR